MTPIQTFLSVVSLGGSLTPDGNNIQVLVPEEAALELGAPLRANKPALLALAKAQGRAWQLVHSKAQGDVFLACSKAARTRLMEMGASPESVHLMPELAELVRAGMEPWQLRILHEGRDMFKGAKITVVSAEDGSADNAEVEKEELRPDQEKWLPVARQVVNGEFDGSARSVLEAVYIGVRSIRGPECRAATERLYGLLVKKGGHWASIYTRPELKALKKAGKLPSSKKAKGKARPKAQKAEDITTKTP